MIGTTLGHYRLLRELEQGGTATVYLAEDIHLHRQVAVKVFDPDLNGTDHDEFLAHFAREARVLASLDHPHILPVYDYGEQETNAYLVMPFMPGGSLRDYLRRQSSPIPPERAISFLRQILLALEYAHARGLIHRDIKPGNILFKNDETLMLSDFGLVKVVEREPGAAFAQDLTRSGGFTLKGTPSYMAPEQIQGHPNISSDIYSLGVVAYEMLTGERPFQADDMVAVLMKHLNERPRPLREINPALSPALEDVVLHTLEKDPTRRFLSATAFRTALEEALKSPRTQHSTPSSSNATHRASSSPYQTQLAMPLPAAAEVSQTPQSNQSTANSAGVSSQASAYPTAFQQRATITPQSFPPQGVMPTPSAPPRPRASSRWSVLTYILIGVTLATSIFAILYSSGYLSGNHAQNNTPGPVTQTTPPGQTPAVSTPTTITTDCPQPNTARPAVLHQIALGDSHQLIYIVNEGPDNAPIQGTLKRRNVDSNTQAMPILQLPGVHITEAQITQNGQWIIYTVNINGAYQLRLLRVDGQEQQTLYCAPSGTHIADSQLSYNGQQLIFNLYLGELGKPSLYLLNIINGTVQRLLEPQGSLAYTPATWLDNNQVYLTSFVPNSDVPRSDLYLLDITRGTDQHDKDLRKILNQNWSCGSFDDSYNSQQLFLATCSANQSTALPTPAGPTTITVQSATGGSAQTIAHIDQAVTMLRTISSTTILYMVENGDGDSSQNGLWRMNIDGSNRQRLTTDTTGGQSLSPFSHYAWANVSMDGKFFALQEANPQSANRKIYYGSVSDGNANYFADISDGTDLLLVGWTRI